MRLPQTQDVNWTYIRRSEDVQDVLCNFNLRPVSTGTGLFWYPLKTYCTSYNSYFDNILNIFATGLHNAHTIFDNKKESLSFYLNNNKNTFKHCCFSEYIFVPRYWKKKVAEATGKLVKQLVTKE